MKIILVRHGQSTANKDRIIQGHKDYPLTQLGIQQAKELAHRMLKNKTAITAVYSSDLLRAKKTAEIIAEALEIPEIQYDIRLREMNLGDRQGKYLHELTEEENQFTEKVWEQHDLRFPNGESVNDMKNRVEAVFNEIIDSHNESDTVLIVGHGGSLYHILFYILGVFPDTEDWFINCSYNELRRENAQDNWKLAIFNGKENSSS